MEIKKMSQIIQTNMVWKINLNIVDQKLNQVIKEEDIQIIKQKLKPQKMEII